MSVTATQAANPAVADENYLDEKHLSEGQYPINSHSSHPEDGGEISYNTTDKALLRKLDLKLLPALTLLYLLSFLDRSNGMLALKVDEPSGLANI